MIQYPFEHNLATQKPVKEKLKINLAFKYKMIKKKFISPTLKIKLIIIK